MNVTRTAVLSIVIASLTGCTTTAVRTEDSRLAAAAADPTRLTILRGDGSKAAWEEVVAAASGADAVLLGECHGQIVGQAFQSKFFRDLISRQPSAGGALEFFERDEQAALDDYLNGVSSESEFRRATRRTDSNYTPGHRTIVEECKAAGRPVAAANAPRRYVRLARQDGFDRLGNLSAEQKRLFVVPEFLPEGRYRDDFFKVMGGEKLLKAEDGSGDPAKAAAEAKQRENISNAFRSQSVWDWTMADSVAMEMDRGGKPVVLVVGRFHIDHAGGLVQALRHMRPGAKIVTITNIDAWAGEIREEDRGIADFVVYVGE